MKTVNSYETTKFLINSDGEILREIKENDTITIQSAKEKSDSDYYSYKKKIEEREAFAELISKECGTFYFDFFKRGLDELNIKESIKVRFLFLCTYSNYAERGSYLVYDNGVKIDKKGLKKLLGGSDCECNATIKTMIDNELLYKEDKYFKVNEKYIKRGSLSKSEVKERHTRIFDNGLRALYNGCSQKQHKQLYYIFKLLPYVSLRFNVICHNPEQEDENLVNPMKLSQICDVVGYDKTSGKKLEKELLKLQLFGEYSVLGIITGDGVWYKMNPKISYAGTSGCLEDFYNLLSTDFRIKTTKKNTETYH